LSHRESSVRQIQVLPGDGAAVIRNRQEALAAGHGWDRQRMLGNMHVFDEGVDLDDPAGNST
jgi:hypothetical protein